MTSRPLQIDLPPAETRNASGYIPWIIALICAAALIVLVSQLLKQIPASLQDKAASVLASSSFTNIAVNTSGRDVQLTGSINLGQSPSGLIESLADIEGVRAVVDDLLVIDPTEAKQQKLQVFAQALQDIETEKVAFQAGSVTFTPQSEPALQALFELLSDNPEQRIRIEGHTDNTGPNSVNLRFSQDRASAVANYLSRRGIAPEQLIVKGYGSTQPIDTNDTEAGRSRNRRIEISHVY